MIEAHKELARWLRVFADEIAERAGQGEANNIVSAALALEALTGEVEDLKSFFVGVEGPKLVKKMRDEVASLTAERDRLKAALEAFVKHFGPLQDNAMLHENVRNCYRLARKALGGDAS